MGLGNILFLVVLIVAGQIWGAAGGMLYATLLFANEFPGWLVYAGFIPFALVWVSLSVLLFWSAIRTLDL